jgi:hypothetical protein
MRIIGLTAERLANGAAELEGFRDKIEALQA